MPERAGSFYIVSIHKINRYVKLVSATFSPEDEQTTMDLIAQISAKLPFCIKLTPDQRKRLPKLDDGRIPFVDKGLDFGLQQPKVLPPFSMSGMVLGLQDESSCMCRVDRKH